MTWCLAKLVLQCERKEVEKKTDTRIESERAEISDEIMYIISHNATRWASARNAKRRERTKKKSKEKQTKWQSSLLTMFIFIFWFS